MTNLEAVPDITEATLPAPPEGLGDAGTELWASINQTFDFTDEPGKLAVLERAAKTSDLIAKLEAAAAEAPMTVKGSMGQTVISPFISEIRAQTTVFNQLMKSLGLPDSDEETVERAARRSRAGKKAANTRWGNAQ